MQALILTGGRGTRLRPLTLYSPKPLLPIVNLPFLSYPSALLRKHGAKELVLCTADALGPYQPLIKAEARRGTTVRCSKETKALGTAGAIKNAEKFIDSEDFFVLNGDVLTDINLGEMLKLHKSRGALVTIALTPVANPSAYGLILTDKAGRIQKFIEKPKTFQKSWGPPYYINAGIYLFSRKVFDLIPKNQPYSSERELFPGILQEKLPMYGYRAKTSYWLDIGTPEKYLQANLDVLGGQFKVKLQGQSGRGSSNRIHRSAYVAKNVVMGNGCAIGANAKLSGCVLMDGVKIGDEAEIENCVIGSRAIVGPGSKVRGARILGNGSKLTPYSLL